MRHLLRAALPSLVTVVAMAQEEPVTPPVPPVDAGEGPNADFKAQLEAIAASLHPEQMKPFFHALRKTERDLRIRLEFTQQTLNQARKLQRSLEAQAAPTVGKAKVVVDSEAARLKAYKNMAVEIQDVRHRLDPQQLDADELQVDLYGGFMFSSLYEDSAQNASFFSKSRPFASLDIRQAFRHPGSDARVETFSTLSFQSSSVEQSDTVNVITSSGQFRAEVGAWWLMPLTENTSWGPIGAMGLVGSSMPEATGQGLEASSRDSFQGSARLSLALRQETGGFKGSFAEWGYMRDPLFLKRDRLFIRGRVVLTQLGSNGSGGDFYIEGSVNKGSAGRDEAVLLVGIGLSTISFLRSLSAPQAQ